MARAICGVYHRGGAVPGRAPDSVAGMLAELPGLGRTGQTGCGAVSFGCRELWADVNEDEAWQARCSAKGLIVAADARLDNRAELADALRCAEGTDATDCELILRAYGRWGEDCPARLYGDYAFAVWNPGARSLFCARDAVGARPFHYALAPRGRFVFASDVAAVLSAPGVEDDLNEASATAFLRARLPQDIGGTFFRAVRSLPPGHSIRVDAETERLRRWWRPERAPPVRRASDADYEREFLDLLRQAVDDRLRGGHPVGAHLSGGLDSSSIAVLAARELRPSGQRLHAFCWHPPPDESLTEEEAAEYRLIEAVCAQESLQPRYHAISVDHALDLLRRDGTRFANRDGTLIHETLVQRGAAELGVRVILAGWGGDDVASYSGKAYWAGLLLGGHLGRLLREVREAKGRARPFVAWRAVRPLLPSGTKRIISALHRGEWPGTRRSFIHPVLAWRHWRRPVFFQKAGVRRSQLTALASGHLAQRMEDWAASGARVGVEYRYPLLDRRLIEFVLGLPAEQFRPWACSRPLMRRALRSLLPPLVLAQASKFDPARYRSWREAVDEVSPMIAKQLAARHEPPVRSRYIDMTRLRAYLASGVHSKRPSPGKVYRTLQFLDWHMK